MRASSISKPFPNSVHPWYTCFSHRFHSATSTLRFGATERTIPYDLLFRASAETLLEVVAEPQARRSRDRLLQCCTVGDQPSKPIFAGPE
jgi:hypothetical protein